MATATAEKNVEAKARQGGGKNDARRLRQSGLIPAVVYGAGQDSQAIAVDPKQICLLYTSRGSWKVFIRNGQLSFSREDKIHEFLTM